MVVFQNDILGLVLAAYVLSLSTNLCLSVFVSLLIKGIIGKIRPTVGHLYVNSVEVADKMPTLKCGGIYLSKTKRENS